MVLMLILLSLQLISGDHVGALAMSESTSGSDVVSMRLRAEDKGQRSLIKNNTYCLQGKTPRGPLIFNPRGPLIANIK